MWLRSNNSRRHLPVYLLLVTDKNRFSEIVGHFIVAEKTKVLMEEVAIFFKKTQFQLVLYKVRISDKDFNEREASSKCFPMASLVICPYHTLRSFQREITCEKMEITSVKGLRCFEIIQQISYAWSEN